MSERHLSSEVATVAAKMSAGPGITVFGVVTLNDAALILGMLCSLVIFAHTAWKFWCDVQDRKARKAAP
jgi:hypothetical protein